MAYRHVVAFLIFISSLSLFIDRTNLPVTILYMTNSTRFVHSSTNETATSDVCPRLLSAEPIQANITVNHEAFDWDRKTQGKILGAFYWSFMLMQIPAGLLTQRFGPKWICFLSLVGIGCVNLTFPVAVDYVWALVILRIISGVLQAPVIACTFGVIAKWTPQDEKSTTIAMGQIGKTIGCIFTSAFAGYISKYHHWPTVFYISGAFISAVGSIYCLLVTNDPIDHHCVTDKEYNYIIKHIPKSTASKGGRQGFPWKKVLTSRAVWVMNFNRFAFTIAGNLIMIKFPGYLNAVMGMDIDEVGYFMSITNAFVSLSNLASAIIADYCIKQKYLGSKTNTRKLFNTISFLGTFTMFCLIPAANCRRTLLLVVVNLLMVFHGLQSGGLLTLVTDLTNEHSPTLNGLAITVAMSSGCILPYILGVIFDAWPDHLKHAWWWVFYVVAAFQLAAAVIFALFGSAELQDWEPKVVTSKEMIVMKGRRRRYDSLEEEANRMITFTS